MNYAPAGKSGLTSLEFVEFNSSATLSQQYTILGKAAKEVGKVYEKSGDETLKQLAQGYQVMEKESKHLAKLVEKQLHEYDREILQSLAIITDLAEGSFEFWLCLFIVDQICMFFAGMGCDYVAGIVVTYVCAIICGGPWNWVSALWECTALYISFARKLRIMVAVGAYYICLRI